MNAESSNSVNTPKKSRVIQPGSVAAKKLQESFRKGPFANIFGEGPGPLGAFDRDEAGNPVEETYRDLWAEDEQFAAAQRLDEYRKRHAIQA